MKYDAKNGYGLQFTKFDEQYEDTIIYKKTREEIIRFADIILRSFDKKGLMEELNNMQANAYTQDDEGNSKLCEIFENKFEIPSYFVNLILAKHGMKVLGW